MYVNTYEPPTSAKAQLTPGSCKQISTRPNGHLSSNGHLSAPSNGHLSTSTPSCNRTISYDSGCTSASASETMLLNHDYADPIEIKENIKMEMEKIDRQKRANLLYEPMKPSRQKGNDLMINNSSSKRESEKERVCRCTTHTWCLLFVFIVSSCSLGLCLLITFGVLDTKGSIRQEDPAAAKLTNYGQLREIEESAGNVEKLKIVDDLKKNISLLNKQIPTFVHHLARLQLQLQLLSKTPAPSPSTTTTTTTHRPKVSRLSKCRYKTEVKNEPFGETPETTLAKTPWLEVDSGYELVGASCSTIGGSQDGLFHKEVRGRQYFQCRCAGKATTEAFKAGNLECKMHYWECPIYIGAE